MLRPPRLDQGERPCVTGGSRELPVHVHWTLPECGTVKIIQLRSAVVQQTNACLSLCLASEPLISRIGQWSPY